MRVVGSRAVLAAAALALSFAAACGSDSGSSSGGGSGGSGSATPLNISTCGAPSGSGQFTVVSDLPLQGASKLQTDQMVKAIDYVLKQHDYKAGKYTVQYQSCDDSTQQAGKWDAATCTSNANEYARNQSVIGVIGTFNSGCAELEVPVLNRVSTAMVSPANTWPGLTIESGLPGEPDKYYPTGTRNYARVVANDQIQGPADAQFAKDIGLKSIFVLNDEQTYGFGVATTFRGAAPKLGLKVAGFQGWDAKQSSYEALANTIKQSGADGVFLGGIICNNGAKLIKDLKAGVPDATLIAPDGFSDPKSNTASFDKSDGTRASVTKSLFGLKVTDGIIGTFTINDKGDTSLNPITIYQQKAGKLNPLKTIIPAKSLTGAT
jgi:branched-chain amino acid transport system substrate-binding protein